MRSSRVYSALLSCLVFCLFLLVALLTAPVKSHAQTMDDDNAVHITPRAPEPAAPAKTNPNTMTGKPFRTETNLVLVPATVTDDDERLVTGLEKKNFVLYQDNKKEPLQALWSDDAPVSVGIIFDVSGSMKDKIMKSREAIRSFLETANPQDEFFLITFSDRPQLTSGFSRNIDHLSDRLMFTQPQGRTALLDAIYLGLATMKSARYPRKALLIISDGGDNHSRYTEGELKSMVQEADVQIFGIGIFDMFAATPEEQYGPELLSDITKITGGRTFTVSNVSELPDIANKIGIALRDEYILAYAPTVKPHDGKWHKIRVKLLPPKGLPQLHISARQGYYAATE
jgi:Ca-activated chloride channel homolog